MKALSIRMPWAYLIARGIKTIENRTWDTQYRGRFYIHAGQKFDSEALQDRRLSAKESGGLIDLQTGIHIGWLILLWDHGMSGIIGEATLVKVIRTSASAWFDGPYGFCLSDAVLYPQFIKCKGQPGFFEPDLSGSQIDLSAKVAELEEKGERP